MNKREIPQFIVSTDILIASSYRREQHLKEVRAASFLFQSMGYSVYPTHNAQPINPDKDFVFLGGEKNFTKRQIERHYLEGLRKAKLVYVVASGGYLDPSASIETAYSLAINAPLIQSEPINTFGDDVPVLITQILKNASIPIVGIEKLRNKSTLEMYTRRNGHFLNAEQRKTVFSGLIYMFRQLREK